MHSNGRVKVGIIGSQFEADIHAASTKMASEFAEVVAVASPTQGNAAVLAKRYGIPRVFTDYREMLKEQDIEMVTIAAPNALHAQMTGDCANAGKHVVCEKPLAMTVEEGEQMIHDTRNAGVLLLYAEELLKHNVRSEAAMATIESNRGRHHRKRDPTRYGEALHRCPNAHRGATAATSRDGGELAS